MLTSISSATLYSSTATPVPLSGNSGQNSLQSQSSVPVVDSSKYVQQKSSIPAPNTSTNSEDETSQSPAAKPVEQTNSSTELSDEAKQVINQLKARDAEVRAHEMAHQAAAGGYSTGGASYSYQVGPDGRRYAIGGEVSIDVSPVAGDPEATLQKAMVVQRAALAPAEPSSQDMKVASSAIQMANQARVEIATKAIEEKQELSEDSVEADEDNSSNESVDSSSHAIQFQLNEQNQSIPDRNGFDLRVQLQQVS
ncbi:MAG: putative metalloprotease CJM1_0395 family protein [Pseudomonadota bacterium]|nr:putative metalloprotease CJM1_0395 family protein [Pseudomonadota bacterium]